MPKLPVSFYQRDDVLTISRELLGKSLYTRIEGQVTGGKIVETEAYAGAKDKACHAYGNRYTKRTQTMFRRGGIAYIYLCYGIHHLFNVITNREGVPDAVLIRAVEPHTGIDKMLERRKMHKPAPQITRGPGCLSNALGIHVNMDSFPLNGNTIWIAEDDQKIPANKITTSPRIGINYAGEYRDKPWRFYIQDNLYVSRK